MKLHEKIKKILAERGISIKELRLLIVNEFKDNAVSHRTLSRIESGKSDGRGQTLHQICSVLGMTLSELKKDTEEENKPVDLIKSTTRLGGYPFNEKAYADLLIRQNHNFMVTKLRLTAGGKTELERDPEFNIDENTSAQLKEILKNSNLPESLLEEYRFFKFEKYVYCLNGSITCYIGNEKYVLKYGDGIVFGSSLPHWFENNTNKEARCLIFQNPRHL